MRRVRRGDRGATVVEYALVLALFVVASIAAAQFVEDETGKEVDNQANCLSTRPPPTSCQLAAIDPVGGGAAGNGGPNGGGGVPTTETAVVLPAGAPQTTSNGPLFDAEVGFTLTDTSGQPIPDEVMTARVTVTPPPINPASRAGEFFYVDCVTDNDGSCTFEFNSRFSDVQEVSVDVISAGIDTNYDFGTLGAVVVGRP